MFCPKYAPVTDGEAVSLRDSGDSVTTVFTKSLDAADHNVGAKPRQYPPLSALSGVKLAVMGGNPLFCHTFWVGCGILAVVREIS